MDGGFIVLVGCLEMGGLEVGYGLWLKCWGCFLYKSSLIGSIIGFIIGSLEKW